MNRNFSHHLLKIANYNQFFPNFGIKIFEITNISIEHLSFFPDPNRVIVTTWVHGRTYDLNLFRFKTLVPSYSVSVYSILCEKGTILTDTTLYRNGFIQTLQGTEIGAYWCQRVQKWVLTDITGYENGPHGSLLKLQGSILVLTDITGYTLWSSMSIQDTSTPTDNSITICPYWRNLLT